MLDLHFNSSKAIKIGALVIALLGLIYVGGLSPTEPRETYAQGEGEVTFRLERVRVTDPTDCFISCLGDNDEPYFSMISFQSRPYKANSTHVELANRLYEFASLDKDQEAEIPEDAGVVTFDQVHFLTIDSISRSKF